MAERLSIVRMTSRLSGSNDETLVFDCPSTKKNLKTNLCQRTARLLFPSLYLPMSFASDLREGTRIGQDLCTKLFRQGEETRQLGKTKIVTLKTIDDERRGGRRERRATNDGKSQSTDGRADGQRNLPSRFGEIRFFELIRSRLNVEEMDLLVLRDDVASIVDQEMGVADLHFVTLLKSIDSERTDLGRQHLLMESTQRQPDAMLRRQRSITSDDRTIDRLRILNRQRLRRTNVIERFGKEKHLNEHPTIRHPIHPADLSLT